MVTLYIRVSEKNNYHGQFSTQNMRVYIFSTQNLPVWGENFSTQNMRVYILWVENFSPQKRPEGRKGRRLCPVYSFLVDKRILNHIQKRRGKPKVTLLLI